MHQTHPRIDPVQHVIDWQLRSRSIPSDQFFGGSNPDYISMKNHLESRLLGAIQAMHYEDTRNNRIYLMHCEGYKPREIGQRFSISTRQAQRIIKNYSC